MTGVDLQTAQDVRDKLLRAWGELQADRHQPGTNYQASLDAVEEEAPPPGLAVGYVADEDGRAWVGVRTTAQGKKLRAVQAMVADVIEKQDIPIDFRIVPTPVIEPPLGQLNAGAGLTACFAGHCRPLHLGCSVSHENGPAGTLGAFVRLADQIGILSCSHVLAMAGDARVGDNVCQPAQQDQGQPLAENRIGKLSKKFAPLIAGKPNNLDAAVALLDRPELALGNCIPDIEILGTRAIPVPLRGKALGRAGSITTVPRRTRVAKIGRSSGYTEGDLLLLRLTNIAPYLWRNGKRAQYAFPDVIEVESLSAKEPFAVPGDSGALVFTLSDKVPIGIHFLHQPIQNGPSLNYLMPLERICAMFALEVR